MRSVKEQRLVAVQAEILAERAAALRTSETRLRKALTALADFDAARSVSRPRQQLRATASEACLVYVVQREALGSTAADLRAMRTELAIPDDVWNGMGSKSD
jgi:hypothetical protein